jgi:hypothetical protein
MGAWTRVKHVKHVRFGKPQVHVTLIFDLMSAHAVQLLELLPVAS